MALETTTFIGGLVATNPTSSDNVGDGDNHIRLVKASILATFPAITGAITGTHTAINTAVNLAAAATDQATANTLLKRDSSGAVRATTFFGNVVGNVTGSTSGGAGSAGSAATATTANEAIKLQTARNIILGGSGSDVTGTASFDGQADATIVATVVNNSHTHEIGTLNGRAGKTLTQELETIEQSVSGSAVASAGKWTTGRSITLGGDLSGNVVIDGASDVTLSAQVANYSHQLRISNVDGLQGALNAKLESTSNAASATELQTARNVQISGAVTGTVSFDGSTDVNLVASSNISVGDVSGLTAAIAAATLAAWPVGSIMSTTASSAPGFGGTWVAYGAGRVQIGQTSSDSDFATVGGATSNGGSKTATLAVTNLPAHSHNFQRENPSGTGFVPGSGDGASSEYTSSTATTGDGTPFSILPPYVVVYMWRRIS